ncbi:MAG: hypothetical protein GKR91_08430 [Pseudomonadales bacterium]|nr:hypothetical protein [Pseudomonadales bacterium]
MPALKSSNGKWIIESAEILETLGFDTLSREEMNEAFSAWAGVTHRVKSFWTFANATSQIREPANNFFRRLLNQFLRSFSVLYFYLRLKIVVLLNKFPDPIDFGKQFLYWEEQLTMSNADFLGGNSPNSSDFMLFGMIQCHCSIPTPPVIALVEDNRLIRTRKWVSNMQKRFSNYPHLYSGAFFEPFLPPPLSATTSERMAFWIGMLFMILAFPITGPLMIVLALNRTVE